MYQVRHIGQIQNNLFLTMIKDLYFLKIFKKNGSVFRFTLTQLTSSKQATETMELKFHRMKFQ